MKLPIAFRCDDTKEAEKILKFIDKNFDIKWEGIVGNEKPSSFIPSKYYPDLMLVLENKLTYCHKDKYPGKYIVAKDFLKEPGETENTNTKK